ncbi:MAG: Ig-like domain repeat protein, partial [Gemmataceae bacterium]
MDTNQFLPFIRRFLGGLSRKPRATSPFKKLNFELLEGRYTPAYPGPGALGPNFTMSDNGNVRTFSLNNNFTTNGWTQVDISYSNNTDQLIIDGNNRTVIINDTNFAGLFFAGNTFGGTNKPTILKNFNFQSSVNIMGALSKITGSVQLQNCQLELYANINNNGGGLVYNDVSGSGLNVLVTNTSARVYGKVGENAGPLIGYIALNSGNIYSISNCSTVVSDSDSLNGNTLGSGAGAFVGSGISNNVTITSSYVLFNGSMSNGSGVLAGKFLGSNGTLTIDKFYAVTNITNAPFNSTDPSQNSYGMSSYFGGSSPNAFAVSNVNFLAYGINLNYIYGVGPASSSLVTSLAGFSNFSSYSSFNATANTQSAQIGNQPYYIAVTNSGGTTTNTFYTFPTSYADDWALNLNNNTLIDLPGITLVNPDNGPVAGGTTVVIFGTNFSSVTAVNFGSNPAPSFIVDNPNQITAVAPAGSPVTVDVSVITSNGSSVNTQADNYNYIASTTTVLASSANPSNLGQAVTFTATVTASAGTATGSVDFYNGAVLMGSANLTAGVATFVTSSLSLGAGQNITAVYAGNINFNGSTSSPVSQAVYLPPTITSANNTTFVLGLVSNSFQVNATGFPTNLAYSISTGTLPNGVTLNPSTGLLTGAPVGGTVGVYPVTVRVTNGVTTPATQAFTLTVVPAPVPLITGSAPLQTDPNNPGSAVSLYDPNTNQPSGSVVPFPRFMGQIRVAAGDFNMDGRAEVVAAAGPGGGPAITILDSQTGEPRAAFFAYDPSFTGGVFVAVKDFNNDGIADIITGAGLGGGPHVKVFDGVNFQEIRSFFAYESSFTGGVSVGSADINGDNVQDIVTGAGIGGGPLVKVFDGATTSVISQWFAYSTQFTGGVFVAMGDISNDGSFEVVTGAGIGGGP